MNSKTLSIYAAIMAVALVAGIAGVSANSVYADVELKNKMENKDCEKGALCLNGALNLAIGDVNVQFSPP